MAFWADGFWADGFWADGFWVGMGTATPSTDPPVTLDDKDLQTLYGWTMERWQGVPDLPEASWTESPRPGRDGADALGWHMGSRSIILPGHVVAATPTAWWSFWRGLTGLLRRSGTMALGFRDNPDIVIDVLPRSLPDDPMTPVLMENGKYGARANLALWAGDPNWYDRTPTLITSIGAVPVEVPMGTGATDGVLRLASPWDEPEFSLYDSGDTLIATLSFPGETEAGTGQYLFIDTRRCLAYQNASGREEDDPAGPLTAVYEGDWFRFEPEYWDYNASDWCKVACDSGDTGEMQLTYRKRWIGR